MTMYAFAAGPALNQLWERHALNQLWTMDQRLQILIEGLSNRGPCTVKVQQMICLTVDYVPETTTDGLSNCGPWTGKVQQTVYLTVDRVP